MSLIEQSRHGSVLVLTLNHPPANAYSHEMHRELDEAVLAARFDEDVHVLVMTGAGDQFFCAGADIGMLEEVTPEYKYNFCLHANETLCRLEQTPKLVIAALNGHAVGGGLEIALAADLRWAKADGGKVGLPEVALGVLPGTGGTARLSRLLGRSVAFELMASGRTMTMEESKEIGLVHDVLPAENFLDKVIEKAQEYCPPAKASLAVGHIKRSVVSGLEMGFAEHLALERELQQQLFTSDDAKEGLAAFREKRPPECKGQ
ncbi:MAG: enoyl-CoA hydratase/isomerase family protein [Planctomycetota bacterium]|nr:enoyl-CoA hydratase/isomerase family protein [Planctomycetota bacterium]